MIDFISLQVQLKVFLKYFKACGLKWIVTVTIVAVLNEVVKSLTNIALSWWTEDNILKDTSMSHTSEYKYRNLMFIALYAAFGVGESMKFLNLYKMFLYIINLNVSNYNAIKESCNRTVKMNFDSGSVRLLLHCNLMKTISNASA